MLWREVRTWAYGKRILVIKLVYWTVFLICAGALMAQVSAGTPEEAPSTVVAAVKERLAPTRKAREAIIARLVA